MAEVGAVGAQTAHNSLIHEFDRLICRCEDLEPPLGSGLPVLERIERLGAMSDRLGNKYGRRKLTPAEEKRWIRRRDQITALQHPLIQTCAKVMVPVLALCHELIELEQKLPTDQQASDIYQRIRKVLPAVQITCELLISSYQTSKPV